MHTARPHGGEKRIVELVVVVCALTVVGVQATEATQPPRHTLFALGDSYSSGEGAKKFLAGTNTIGSNECRRADSAYPALVAKRADLKLSFAACSGATTREVLAVGQHRDSPSGIFGGEPQISTIVGATKDDVITIGIGGNDAGFSKIVQTCLQSDCTEKEAKWLSYLSTVQTKLTETYRTIRSKTPATVFAITYPNPLGRKNCVLGFSRAEWDFLRVQFIPSLNAAVRAAARDAGVNLIDLEDSYDGFRVCEVKASAAALNIISISLTSTVTKPNDLLHNSFHPNARGHQLASRVVFEAITRTTGNPNPVTPPPGPAPPVSLPPATVPPDSILVSATGPPATSPLATTPPAAAAPAPPAVAAGPISPCDVAPDFVLVDNSTRPVYLIMDAEPSSRACIRRRDGEPETVRVNDKGQLELAMVKGESVVVDYVDNTGHQTQLTVKRR
jgi:lysophospholipase L1-like esterase